MFRPFAGALSVAVLIGPASTAQTSPQALASLVLDKFEKGTSAEFAAIYPFREGRDTVSFATRSELKRIPGLQQVIRQQDDRAFVLISGIPVIGNSGDETILGRGFSGVYEVTKEKETWKLLRRVPLEELGELRSHRLQVKVKPAFGIQVEDRLEVRAKVDKGFAVRLNHAAQLEKVTWRGADVQFAFGGGLLWVDIPEETGELSLRYSVEVEEGPNNTNSGSFLRKGGHVRNQYFWHPFFDFNSSADQAHFQVEARIPEEYYLSMSIPQTEKTEGGERVVIAKTIRPTFALTLVYDRDWKVVTGDVDRIQLQLFVGSEFRPSAKEIVKEFTDYYRMLSRRFGAPDTGYFGVVEARSKEGNGWHFASNQVVVTAGLPRVFAVETGRPGAFFGHEVGHLWSRGGGPAASFLNEGWATYVESLILEHKYGAEVARLYWKKLAEEYFQRYDGKAVLLEDENNSGVAYQKGAWVFRMLEAAVGQSDFDKAMTEFSQRSLRQPAGWEELAACFKGLGGSEFDAQAFLSPWLKEKVAPVLSAHASGKRITISQGTTQFRLPLVIDVTTAEGRERRTIWLRDKETVVEWSAAPQNVALDPENLLLVKRN